MMMRFVWNILVSLSLLVLLMSCGGAKEQYPPVDGDAVPMQYSSLLSIVESEGCTVVDIANPWSEGVMQRYVLVPSAAELPANLPAGVLLRTPLDNVILFSGVHAGLLGELGAGNAIKGVCDVQYIYCDAVADGLAAGSIVDCGSSLDVSMEQVAVASPDAAFVLPYENGGYGKLEKVNFPLIECADYMEISPLACAEWVRFYGRLLGKAAVADSIYDAVCDEYDVLRRVASKGWPRPKLLCELRSSSAWYVPAGGSTMGRMYADAGADYLFSHCSGSGSVPLSFELVLERAADADVWLVKYNSEVDKTYSSLLDEYEGYSHFRPFTEKNIFVCNTREKRLFEDRTFHPERMLKELVALFHPHLLPGYELRYYERMHQ